MESSVTGWSTRVTDGWPSDTATSFSGKPYVSPPSPPPRAEAVRGRLWPLPPPDRRPPTHTTHGSRSARSRAPFSAFLDLVTVRRRDGAAGRGGAAHAASLGERGSARPAPRCGRGLADVGADPSRSRGVSRHRRPRFARTRRGAPPARGAPPLRAHTRPTIGAMADAVEAELDGLGVDLPHVVGNSVGGRVAVELAMRRRARSLVALSPSGLEIPPERAWIFAADQALRLRARVTAPVRR